MTFVKWLLSIVNGSLGLSALVAGINKSLGVFQPEIPTGVSLSAAGLLMMSLVFVSLAAALFPGDWLK